MYPKLAHPKHPALSRDDFRTTVLNRHGGLCCVPGCGQKAADAHHIIERRLWTDPTELGGYYLENGAAVCPSCHLKAESTELDPDDLRLWSGISVALVPSYFYLDAEFRYSKWGDTINPDGSRIPGPLFWDASVQKIIRPFLHLYVTRVKYPRTLHLPWSPGAADDDKVHKSTSQWDGMSVVVTEKMDGENTTVYPDGTMHARSLTSEDHPSRHRLKAEIQRWCYELPAGWRVCGENLTAVHSIKYNRLTDLFQVFSIWDGSRCLSLVETHEWCELLGLTLVPVLFRTVGVTKAMTSAWKEFAGGPMYSEGYVVRPVGEFQLKDFSRLVGKYVRAEHVSSDRHWRFRRMEENVTLDSRPDLS